MCLFAYKKTGNRVSPKVNALKTNWKELTAQQKKQLLWRLVSVVLSGIMFVAVGVVSFAWFASNERTNQSDMQVVLTTDAIDILIERTSEFDSGYDGITGANGLKSVLSGADYSLNAVDTAVSSCLAYELVNEFSMRDDYGNLKYYLQPGSYGTVTFYIRPKRNYDNITLDFILHLGGYYNGYDQETPVVLEMEDDLVKDLLKGHILFFSSYSAGVYGGFIGSGFSYDMSQHYKCQEVGKTDCYKIELFWEWPEKYYDIVDNLAPSGTGKYPAALGTYLSQHGEYFFNGLVDENDESTKSDAYDDADQAIGDAVDYFTVFFTIN